MSELSAGLFGSNEGVDKKKANIKHFNHEALIL